MIIALCGYPVWGSGQCFAAEGFAPCSCPTNLLMQSPKQFGIAHLLGKAHSCAPVVGLWCTRKNRPVQAPTYFSLAFLSEREALTPIGAAEVLGDFDLAAGLLSRPTSSCHAC